MTYRLFHIAVANLVFFVPSAAGEVSALSAANSSSATLEVGLHVTANCKVRAEPLDFGLLNETEAPDAGAASSIQIACTEGTPFMVMLDDGVNAESGARRAVDPASRKYVSYEIYTDPAHTKRWGGLGSEVSGVADTSAVTQWLAYGTIRSTQVAAGDYQDTVTVTVAY